MMVDRKNVKTPVIRGGGFVFRVVNHGGITEVSGKKKAQDLSRALF